jgi:UPF0755 protein
MKQKRKKISCIILILLTLMIFAILALLLFIPTLAQQSFGIPNPSLDPWDRYSYAISLLWGSGKLTTPGESSESVELFVIEQGDSVIQISENLQTMGLIRDARLFRIYLVWKGLDTSVQAGNYTLDPGMTALDIANRLQDATPSEVTFNVLSGWRKEEIAASLPTSGLNITPYEFLTAVDNPYHTMDNLPDGASAEGFLFPGSYLLPRVTTAEQLVSVLMQNSSLYLSAELREGFSRQGLDVYQAVILASIIEREAVIADEQPMIASVFFNRLSIGMKLESDPTVQYALNYDNNGKTWWKNPLTLDDLSIDSLYNTYLYPGLPPAPICNPNLSAMQAVAYPAQTPYYFFRAKCDGSGLHAFSETFEQHLQNACK